MTADTLGGVWTYAMELIKALEPYRVEVALVARGRLPTSDQREQAEKLGCELICLPQKLEWMDDPWDDVAEAQAALQEIVHEVQPDLIHCNDYSAAAPRWEVPTVLTAHSCVYSWFQAVKGALPPQEWAPYRELVCQALERANVVVAPTRAMLEALRVYRADIRNARVIPNGRASAAFYTNVQKQPLVMAAGRIWDEGKNLDVLNYAGERLGWPIYVAGETKHPDQGAIQAAPSLRGLGFLGGEQMRQVLAAASIFAHPARYEPFGLAPLEAALAGCALVLGDIPSLRQVWGNAALYVSCDAPQAWHYTLRQLALDEERRREMASRALKRARFYSLEAFGRAHHNLYGEMTSAHDETATSVSQPGISFSVPSHFQPPFG
ncbi:MAG: hypothetical protein E1N59_252 [Puniceicoccaceae bacterium 5H]|nr:MAG: hypothetical protein E1N59_252 [Puniceicoccaceae bacterium 5H]